MATSGTGSGQPAAAAAAAPAPADAATGKKPGKRRNPRGLSLSILPLPPGDSDDASSQGETSPIHQLRAQLEGMNLDDQQRARFEEFLFNKTKLLNVRELKSDDFMPLKMLGAGNGGVVWKVKHKQTNLILARKMIHLEIKPKLREQILRELKVLHECNSPGIVGFYGSFFSDGEINILMEYMDCGSLDLVVKRVGRIPEDVVGKICHRMLSGLVYLRDNFKIIHRDVKPSNVLLNSAGEVKLCDFGVSGELTNSLANTFVGTRSYMAPERLLGNKYAIESDVWSLALSLVEMAVGYFPIPHEEGRKIMPIRKPSAQAKPESKQANMAIFELLAHIVEGPPPRLPSDAGFSAEFADFVAKCLQKDPEKRPSLQELLDHPWMKRIEKTEVDMKAWALTTIPPEPEPSLQDEIV